MFCTNCGKQMPDNAVFCTSCGNKMAVDPIQETIPSPVQPNETAPVPDPMEEPAQTVDAVPVAKEASIQQTELVVPLSGGPEASAEPVAETPAAPETSAEPQTPVAPEASAVLETPVVPETPADHETPAVPETPSEIPEVSVSTDLPIAPVAAAPAPSAAPSAPSAPAAQVVPVSASEAAPKKSGSPIVFIVGAIAVVLLLVILIPKGSGYKEYKSLVKAYYNAIYKEDFNALVKLYDKDAQKDMKEDKDDIKDELEDAKESFDDRYDRGWQKEVDPKKSTRLKKDDDITYYTVTVDVDGEPDAVGVKKIKDRYFIDEERDHIDD